MRSGEKAITDKREAVSLDNPPAWIMNVSQPLREQILQEFFVNGNDAAKAMLEMGVEKYRSARHTELPYATSLAHAMKYGETSHLKPSPAPAPQQPKRKYTKRTTRRTWWL